MWRDVLSRAFADWLADRGLVGADPASKQSAAQPADTAHQADLGNLLELIRAPARVRLDPQSALDVIQASGRDAPNWTAPSTFATWNANAAASAIAAAPIPEAVRLMAPLSSANAIFAVAPVPATVSPNAPIRAFNQFSASGAVPTDTLFSMEWHLRNPSQTGSTVGKNLNI